jgi:hypothetical protein
MSAATSCWKRWSEPPSPSAEQREQLEEQLALRLEVEAELARRA